MCGMSDTERRLSIGEVAGRKCLDLVNYKVAVYEDILDARAA
jgi:hypothetical protein